MPKIVRGGLYSADAFRQSHFDQCQSLNVPCTNPDKFCWLQVFNLKREVKEMESKDSSWNRDKGGYMGGSKPGGGPKYTGNNKRGLIHIESGPGSADRYNRKRPR